MSEVEKEQIEEELKEDTKPLYFTTPNFESSNIKSPIVYWPDDMDLCVVFKNESMYAYKEVGRVVFDELCRVAEAGESVGKAFNKLVKKGGYNYECIEGPKPKQEEKPEKIFEGMEVGMLWFDNDTKKTIDERIARALEYYRNKYQPHPMHKLEVQIPMADLPKKIEPETEYELNDVLVIGSKHIGPNHILVGYSFDWR